MAKKHITLELRVLGRLLGTYPIEKDKAFPVAYSSCGYCAVKDFHPAPDVNLPKCDTLSIDIRGGFVTCYWDGKFERYDLMEVLRDLPVAPSLLPVAGS